MDITQLLILSLATWRLSSLLVKEDGPYNIFPKLQYLAGVRADEYSRKYGTNVIAKALLCVWCISIWVGFGLTVLWLTIPDYTIIFCLPFALSAVVCLIDKQGGE